MSVPSAFHGGHAPLPPPWDDLFGPLRSGTVDDLVVVGQIGQSLDGRIATNSGHSHYINGPAGLDHLHRLRAVVDAVLIGVKTALVDDPLLTVRRVAGPHPCRVVLDPRGRMPASARMLADDGVRRLVVTATDTRAALPDGVEVVALPAVDGHIAPAAILAALAARGLRRILVEGGANTVSQFLTAGCLDHLHVIVAPIILGTGQPGLALAPIERVDHALRPPTRAYPLARLQAEPTPVGRPDGALVDRAASDEVLFDCDFSQTRVVIGRAKKST